MTKEEILSLIQAILTDDMKRKADAIAMLQDKLKEMKDETLSCGFSCKGIP